MKKYLDFENLDFFLSNLDDRYCTKSEVGDTSSSKVLNVTVNHTISTYTPMEQPTNKKKFYADIPCTQSKTTMNVQISPNDSVENVGLLTYAEPMDGKVRVYFSDKPREDYTIESIELTTVVNSQYILKLKDVPIGEKLKFSSGKTFILTVKNGRGHEPNSVTFASEYIIENAEWGEALSYSESNIHKTIIPKYYNELSELEKKAIIYYNSEVHTAISDNYTDQIIGSDGSDETIIQFVESHFYLADAAQLNCIIKFTVSGSDWGSSEWHRDPSSMPELSSGGEKTFKDGRAGEFYITTTRRYNDNNNLSSSYYVYSVGDSHIPTEHHVGTTPDQNTPTFHTVTSGVLPFCDIKGDTLVMKDADGYWVIVEVPEYALSIAEESLEAMVKSTVQLTVDSTVPAGATLEWSSDNENVATVADGVVTCRGIGKATITASIKKDNTTLISDSCTVIVGEVHI